MSLPMAQSEKASAPEALPTAYQTPSVAQRSEETAVSGRSSISEHGLQKEKTHPDEHPATAAAAARTRSQASGLDGAVARVATADQLPGTPKQVGISVAIALALFLVALDLTIVATAIPAITGEFHSLNDLGWYGSAFFLTMASFQAFWGKVYKYFPLKTAYLLAVFIFEVGSLICGVSRNSVTLIVGRAIAGVGGAGVGSGCYTIIAFSFSPKMRPTMMGFMGAVYGVASVIGPLLGGVFTTHATWRWAFYVNLPIGAVAGAIIFLIFQTPPAAKPAQASLKEKFLQMDLPGTFTIMAAIICFLLAIQWGGTILPWNHRTVIGLFVGFGVLLILGGVIEYVSGERAMLQGRLLRVRNIATACVFTILNGGAFFLLLYTLPLYFQSVDGVSASDSGVRNLPLIIAVAIFTILSGGFISKTGHAVPTMLLGAVLETVGNGLMYMLDIGSPAREWIGYQVLAGIGIGISIQTPMMLCQASVPATDISTVTAILLFFQTLGGAIWVQAGQSAFQNVMVQRLPEFAPGVDPASVLATGASDLTTVFEGLQLEGVLRSYMAGLHIGFAISIALAGMAAIVSLFFKWKSISLPKDGGMGGA